MILTDKEKELLEYAEGMLKKSMTHDIKHIYRVLDHALEIQKKEGGDRRTIVAAAILHDLGRQEKEIGQAHAEKSAAMAVPILKKFRYGEKEIEKICEAIRGHHEGRGCGSVESKILYDADKLDGFGPLGIVRICLHCGEMNYGVAGAVERLKKRMPERAAVLYFETSKKIAKKELKYVAQFVEKLEKQLGGKY